MPELPSEIVHPASARQSVCQSTFHCADLPVWGRPEPFETIETASSSFPEPSYDPSRNLLQQTHSIGQYFSPLDITENLQECMVLKLKKTALLEALAGIDEVDVIHPYTRSGPLALIPVSYELLLQA